MTEEKKSYLVLARKYRPKKLSDIIGQYEISNILKGAFKLNRLAHAYLLSGTRGVGKTTIARIIAKAVNCEENLEISQGDPCGICDNCVSIDSESNIDVIEVDAASRTGVNDMREIIENINYKPVSAKKKIYIIDEVHMLSKAAFNALLKTLEEPPSDVMFLLATTETEKIPITILSRCQRLELKRISNKEIASHLIKISSLEGFNLDKESSEIISMSSGGSLRDALSILDNVCARGTNINTKIVRSVLGLSDSTQVIDFLELICAGKVEESLKFFRNLYENGASLEQLAKDLMRLMYYIARFKSEVDVSGLTLSETEIVKLKGFSKNLEMDVIIRLWELLQKYFKEISRAFDQFQCFEMTIIRLCYVTFLPTTFEISRNENNLTNKNNISNKDIDKSENNNLDKKKDNKNVLISLSNSQENDSTQLAKFENLVKQLESKSEPLIVHYLENSFKLVSIKMPDENMGKGSLELKKLEENNLPDNLLWKISEALKIATDKRWVISISDTDSHQSLNKLYEKRKKNLVQKISSEKSVKKLLEIIPDSEIVSVVKNNNI